MVLAKKIYTKISKTFNLFLSFNAIFLTFSIGVIRIVIYIYRVLYEGKQRLMHGCDIVHKTPTKQVANVNNANNMRIFLTYRRASPQFAHSSLAVIDICIVVASKVFKIYHYYMLLYTNFDKENVFVVIILLSFF